ncbi:MAG: hypothetical protein LUG99_09880 [Lachnospiraceae bacterium]|nr:hypothetical protein [Lachnospiraceae bacterium]
MSDTRQEAAFLIGEADFLHIKEVETGYAYTAFQAGNPVQSFGGEISAEDVQRSPIRSPMTAARVLAMEEAGMGGQPAAQVSINSLEKFRGSGIRRRRMMEPETLPNDDVRFITVDYQERFRIPNGGTVEMIYPDRRFSAKCEYIDDYHLYLNGECLHICQLAEMLERGGGTCRPEPEIDPMRENAGWRLGSSHYLTLQMCDDGWDYTLYDKNFREVDGGQLDNPEMSMLEARETILEDAGKGRRSRTVVGYDFITEKAEAVAESDLAGKRESVLGQLSALKDTLPKAEKTRHRVAEASL